MRRFSTSVLTQSILYVSIQYNYFLQISHHIHLIFRSCLQFRPTPPHLTSPIAESLLTQACENETQNAKRMRMGLEPIATTPPVKPSQPVSTMSAAQQHKSHMSTSVASMPSLVPASMGQSPSQAAAAAAAAQRMFPDWRWVVFLFIAISSFGGIACNLQTGDFC